ncbi:hypothetical protein JHK85_035650 [Glycine max]|nr:hypothetical protein JHK85_035650 [Glycine max]
MAVVEAMMVGAVTVAVVAPSKSHGFNFPRSRKLRGKNVATTRELWKTYKERPTLTM